MKGAHSQFQGCTVASMPWDWHIHFKWYHLALPCKWACHKVIPWLHHFLPVIVVQGPRSKVQAPVSSLAFSLAMAVWRDSLPKTRLRCKTRVLRRPKVSKSRKFRGEAVRSGLAPKARKPFALYVMGNSLVKPGAAKSQYQAELKRLGQAWKRLTPSQQAHYNERSMAELEAQRQAVMSAREKRSNDEGQVSNVPVSGNDQSNEYWLGPYKVKKSGHNGFSAVAGQGPYGKVCIARGECGRLHAVWQRCLCRGWAWSHAIPIPAGAERLRSGTVP